MLRVVNFLTQALYNRQGVYVDERQTVILMLAALIRPSLIVTVLSHQQSTGKVNGQP